MGTMGTITDSQSYSRRLFTALALIALLGAQLFTGAGTAAAHDHYQHYHDGFLVLQDDATKELSQVDIGELDRAGMAQHNYIVYDTEMHFSCSENLLRESVSDGSRQLTVVDWHVNRYEDPERSELTKTCGSQDFNEAPSPSLTKSVDVAQVNPDGSFSYTLTVTNDGDAPARNVLISDTLDLNGNTLSVSSVTTSQGTCTPDPALISDGDTLTCDLGTLLFGDHGSSATITITVVAGSGDSCGTVTNIAHGEHSTGSSFESGSVSVDIVDCPTPDPDIELTKTAVDGVDDDNVVSIVEGDTATVTYEYVVTNPADSSNEAVTGLALVDDKIDDDAVAEAFDAAVSGDLEDFVLDVGESVTFTVDHEDITPEDFDNDGKLTNTAEVTGHGHTSNQDVDDTDDETITLNLIDAPDPVVVLEKEAVGGIVVDGQGQPDTINGLPYIRINEGETTDVTYRYTVTNEGNETLTDFAFTDTKIDDAEVQAAFEATHGDDLELPVGDSVSFTAIHTAVGEGDFDDNGRLRNDATVEAVGVVSGDPTGDEAFEVITLDVIPTPDPVPAITLDKDADETQLVDPAVGEEVNYTFTITNTGDEALTIDALVDVIYDGLGDVEDPGFDLDELTSAVITAAAGESLAVDDELVLTDAYTHVITQDDIDRGGVYNVATVTATGDESGGEVSATDDETVTITVAPPTTPDPEPESGIEIVKSAVDGVDFDEDGLPYVELAQGESADITYEFVITNTGDDDLGGLSLEDTKIGDLTEALLTAVGGDEILDVEESVTVTAVHEGVTLDDFEDGLLVNVATVEGTGVDSGDTVTDTDDESVYDVEILPIGPPSISIEKTAVQGVELDDEGNLVIDITDGESTTIGYEFEITNTSSHEPLTDLSLVDDKIGDLSEPFQQAVATAFGTDFPAGESVTVTADYDVTAEDVAAGVVTNIADVGGVGVETGLPAGDSDVETVLIVEVADEEPVTQEPGDETEVLAEVIEAPIKVEPSDEDVQVMAEVQERQLPRTGVDSDTLLLLGLLLTILGATAITLSPNRRFE